VSPHIPIGIPILDRRLVSGSIVVCGSDGCSKDREGVGSDEGSVAERVLVDGLLVAKRVELVAEGGKGGEDFGVLRGEVGCCCCWEVRSASLWKVRRSEGGGVGRRRRNSEGGVVFVAEDSLIVSWDAWSLGSLVLLTAMTRC